MNYNTHKLLFILFRSIIRRDKLSLDDVADFTVDKLHDLFLTSKKHDMACVVMSTK